MRTCFRFHFLESQINLNVLHLKVSLSATITMKCMLNKLSSSFNQFEALVELYKVV